MKFDKQVIKDLLKEQKVDANFSFNDFMNDLTKEVIEGLLEGELTNHLGYEKHKVSNKKTKNSRNGHTPKEVITRSGKVAISVPRDRNSNFEPITIQKGEKEMTMFSDKVISLYARGLTQRDISEFVKEQYNHNLSAQSISNIVQTVTARLDEWQNRPLEKIYPIVYMDAVVFKVKQDGVYSDLAVNTMIGITKSGHKQCLGFWTVENESSTFWLTVLNQIRNRGVEDILILCSDGLTGLLKSIKAVFPDADHQRCVVHQIRNSLKYLSHRERKVVATDLKTIYSAVTKEDAYKKLIEFDKKWSGKYPYIAKSWFNNWDNLSIFFKYPDYVRKIIYTTNAIESFNQSLRKVTKHRGAFTNKEALLRILFLQAEKQEAKWKRPIPNWAKIIGQFSIYFEEKLSKYL